MNILIVLAHPRAGSFNHGIAHAIAETLTAAGHVITLRDLCAEGFDPNFSEAELARGNTAPPHVREHADAVLAADGIVVVHPNWWGQPPAILKGWLDRVLRPGEAYRFGTNGKGEGVVIGQLKAHAALVITTSNTPREAELALYGDPLDNLWKRCVWGFCGIENVDRINFEPVIGSSDERRAAWLARCTQHARQFFCPPTETPHPLLRTPSSEVPHV